MDISISNPFFFTLLIIQLLINLKNKTMKNLIGKQVKIISDNDNYDNFRNDTLVITHASNEGRGYDSGMYPEMLCDFKIKGSSKEFPFALYEYEFEVIGSNNK